MPLIPKTNAQPICENNDELSKEIVEHIANVQERIYEINVNVKEQRIRKLELNATLEGLHNWFTRQGFSELEIYYLMKDLDIEKEFYVN
jgi:uncharacterized protein YjgD (DUF1641 family)